jgi:hypothetical protein
MNLKRTAKERIDELLKANTEYLDGWREEKQRGARLLAAMKQAFADNIWHAYHAGVVSNDLWFDAGASDAEWLERELGLPLHRQHPIEHVTSGFPSLIERLAARVEQGAASEL